MNIRVPYFCFSCGAKTPDEGFICSCGRDYAAPDRPQEEPDMDKIALVAELKVLRDERDSLRAALMPFAAEARKRSWITNLSSASGMDDLNIGGSGLTNGHLRAAMDALEGKPFSLGG